MKKTRIILLLAALFIWAISDTGFAETLPMENQPASSYNSVHKKFFNQQEKILETLYDEKERGEDETEEAYENRIEEAYQERVSQYYQKTRTIYFFEERYYNYRDEYDAETNRLILHPFDYQSHRIYMGDLNYLVAQNFDEFSDFETVRIPMSRKEADRTRRELVEIIGIELKYNPDTGEDVVYKEEDQDISRYDGEQTVRYMDVYLKSLTLYNKRTDEIYAQKHIFDEDAPVWDFQRKIEEKVNNDTCFIETVASGN